MPRTPEKEVVQRALATRRRQAALEELVPLLQEKVNFPDWLLALVWEHGVDNLSLREIWSPRGDHPAVTKQPEPKAPKPKPLSGMANPTANEVLGVLLKNTKGLTTGKLGDRFKVSRTTMARKLRTLLSEGMVYRFGPRANMKYEISDLGRARLQP